MVHLGTEKAAEKHNRKVRQHRKGQTGNKTKRATKENYVKNRSRVR